MVVEETSFKSSKILISYIYITMRDIIPRLFFVYVIISNELFSSLYVDIPPRTSYI
jgi:hypothetical protein